MADCDVAIVGGGIVGLATAYQLTRRDPPPRVIVLEKEAELAIHQTGHNSGVLHSGIYYRPDSLRARLCRQGKQAMQEFCAAEGIPFQLCGKVIVALDESELPALEKIHQRGLANQTPCALIDQPRLRELEPHAAGIRAIHVPDAGIVDYRQAALRMAERIRERGGRIQTRAGVSRFEHRGGEVVLETAAGPITADRVVTCGGLHADRLTRQSGQPCDLRIVPFRGEFFKLKPHAWPLCQGLIYPVPDTRFPFLGVHFTRIIEGGVECGPNAVLALAREGYRWRNVNLRDLWDAVSYRGFRRLAWKYWRTGLAEMWRSLSRKAFLRSLQRLVPEITLADLETAPAGVRAQAVTPAGELLDDFHFQRQGRVLNVCNAPSPAATTSLQIGLEIVRRLEEEGGMG